MVKVAIVVDCGPRPDGRDVYFDCARVEIAANAETIRFVDVDMAPSYDQEVSDYLKANCLTSFFGIDSYKDREFGKIQLTDLVIDAKFVKSISIEE